MRRRTRARLLRTVLTSSSPPWDHDPVGPRLRVRRTRAGLGRTVRSAHRGTVTTQVLMQLLLRG